MKKKLNSTFWLVLILLVGLSLLLYPSVSDYWNTFRSSYAIAGYAEAVANMQEEDYERMWQEAAAYNRQLGERGIKWHLSDSEEAEYGKLLDVTGTGIMGYVEIKKIHCTLPIYHGTEEGVLQIAIGHIAGSSLPVGGESSHCIISGHRGLPSARLFTDLDKLTEGDLFLLRTLDETLTYEVDQIRIVLPYELDELKIEEGHDYCTLVTCTPYGVNSHRLLVRGHRVDNRPDADSIRITGDALIYDPLLVAPVVAVPILLILLVRLFVRGGRKGRENKERKGTADETA